jgi:biotin transport system substrate-specific component
MSPIASAVAIVSIAAAIAVGAQITVPMTPVPMTMQTFAVLLAGAAFGPARATAATLLYLAAAAAGLPLLSDGASGLTPFAGPTAGYLLAFPLAAALVGLSARRGGLDRPVTAFSILLGAHVLILSLGAGWLAFRIGPEAALRAGFVPFLIGAAVKSALVLLARRLLRPLLPRV